MQRTVTAGPSLLRQRKRKNPTFSLGEVFDNIILRDIGCGPARQSTADALGRGAVTQGRGASKEQQALACLGTWSERPRFPDEILEGMLGHSRNPGPASSTHDLPLDNVRRVPKSPAPESFSSKTVSASKPASRRIDAYSVGRFSSTLNFKL